MLGISEDFKKKFHDDTFKYIDEHAVHAIDYEDFIANVLDQKAAQAKVTYPREIRIAKPIKDLLDGDFEPARVLTIPSPILYKGHPIWTQEASSGVELHAGYINGDKRFLSEIKLDAKDLPHGTLAGSTGSGKSVTLNAMVFAMLFLYPPWELNLYLADPKIVEFSRYANCHHVPHIKSIGATGDTGYIVSMLKKMYKDMNDMNTVFSKVGAKNLKEFEQKTNLRVPRVVGIFDEYQTLIKEAGKNVKEIIDIFDLIARLGRSTGYNLFLASQEVASEVKPILANIPVRLCLKCTENVSTMILGNDEGALGDVGIGKLYANTKPNQKNPDDNIKFRVPYQNDDQFVEEGKFLEKVGLEMNLYEPVNFYDEKAKITDEQFLKTVEDKKANSVIIGIPSFVCPTPDRFEVEFNGDDFENFLVYASDGRGVYRFFKTFYLNALVDKVKNPKVQHDFIIADKSMIGSYDPESDGFKTYSIRGTDSVYWKSYQRMPYVRLLAITVDEKAFESPVYDDKESIELYNALMKGKGANNVNYSRMFYMRKLLNDGGFKKYFGLDKIYKEDELRVRQQTLMVVCFNTIFNVSSKFVDCRLTYDDLDWRVVHVVGHQRVNGLGRSTRNMDPIKQMLMDAPLGKMRYVFYSSNLSEFSEINDGFRYYILDNASKVAMKVKCDNYPLSVRPASSVFFDRTLAEDNVKTFKKISIPGDTF